MITEMKGRFEKTQLPSGLLFLVPSAVVHPSWRYKKPEWERKVMEAMDYYEDDLPSPSLVQTELTLWNDHW